MADPIGNIVKLQSNEPYVINIWGYWTKFFAPVAVECTARETLYIVLNLLKNMLWYFSKFSKFLVLHFLVTEPQATGHRKDL